MSRQTSFEIEDAEDFSNQLQEFQKSLEQEWCEVLNQWENLRSTWRDDQYYQFESLFEDLLSTYTRAEKDFEKNIAVVERQIGIAETLVEKRQLIPPILTRLFTTVVAGAGIASSVIGLHKQNSTPIDSNNSTQASIKTVKEVYKPIAEYEKLQLEKEKKRVKREQDIAANAKAQPTTSGSPPDPKAQFANSLDYKAKKTTWDDGETTIRIDTFDSNGADIGAYLNARIQSDSRVHIRDTEVGEAHRKQGIGSKMLQTLENQLPNGTELYFIENQAKDYWEKKGFKPRQLNDGKIEYFKKISRE